MKEVGIYKPIPGYSGIYEIDTFGNVRKAHGGRSGDMKPIQKKGQLIIKLQDPAGRRKEERIHKLVQVTFIGPAPPGKVLYHKNGDKMDNCLINLGFIDRSRLGEMTGYKSRQQAVLKLDPGGEIVQIYRSARAAGRDNYMSYQAIMDRCNGKVKSKLAPDGHQYIWDEDYNYEIGNQF